MPTHRAFCIEMPPAVMIEPVVADVASVVRVELTPAAAVSRPLVESVVNAPVLGVVAPMVVELMPPENITEPVARVIVSGLSITTPASVYRVMAKLLPAFEPLSASPDTPRLKRFEVVL